ncbi:MAG: O-antigen ligase family protein [Hyphomicrobiaceae bacterium]
MGGSAAIAFDACDGLGGEAGSRASRADRTSRRPARPRKGTFLSELRHTPLPVAALILGIICPSELSLFLGGIRLPPHRIALLVFLLPALFRLIRQRDIRIGSFDVAFMLFGAWQLGVFIHHEGVSGGGQFGGALALESLGSYLVARAYVRDYESFRGAIRFLFAMIMLLGSLAFVEAVSGVHFIHDVLYKMTGFFQSSVRVEKRLGLIRAYATFDHPIIYGTFCASLMSLLWFTTETRNTQIVRSSGLALATFLGLSSAPLLSLGVQATLITWDRVTRGVDMRVPLTLIALVGLYIGIEIVSSRPAFEAIIMRVTLDPWTAFYRMQIWHYGLENVWMSPFLGAGLAGWERIWWMSATTVDAFWLLVPMRMGIPAVVLLLLSAGLLMRAVNRRQKRPRFERDAAIGWTISIISIGLVGLTVHYWNSIHAHVFLLLGLGAWLADPAGKARGGGAGKGRSRRKGRAPARGGGTHAPAAEAVVPGRGGGAETGTDHRDMPAMRAAERTMPAADGRWMGPSSRRDHPPLAGARRDSRPRRRSG